MKPLLFSQRSAFGFVPTWYWFHAEDCRPGYKALPVDRQPWPADLDWVFMAAPPAQPDQPRAAALQSALFPELTS